MSSSIQNGKLKHSLTILTKQNCSSPTVHKPHISVRIIILNRDLQEKYDKDLIGPSLHKSPFLSQCTSWPTEAYVLLENIFSDLYSFGKIFYQTFFWRKRILVIYSDIY